MLFVLGSTIKILSLPANLSALVEAAGVTAASIRNTNSVGELVALVQPDLPNWFVRACACVFVLNSCQLLAGTYGTTKRKRNELEINAISVN